MTVPDSLIVFRPGPRAAPWAASARRGRPSCWWARSRRSGPDRLIARPAGRAGRQNGGTPLHYDGRAAGAAVKAETRMASDVVLPSGTAARSPTAVVSPTPRWLAARPRSSLAPTAAHFLPPRSRAGQRPSLAYLQNRRLW